MKFLGKMYLMIILKVTKSQGFSLSLEDTLFEKPQAVINKSGTHHHEHNPTHNAIFRKNYTTVIGRLLPDNSFLEDSFIKAGTDIAFSEEVCAFINAIPEIGQKQYKEFGDTRLIRCKKLSNAITKNNCATPAKSTAKADPQKRSTRKESDFNKLRTASVFRPFLCAEVFKIEMTGLP